MQEVKKYTYQPTTGDAKVDKARNSLVDDFNTIVDKRLTIMAKAGLPSTSAKVTRDAVVEVMNMATNSKKRWDQLHGLNYRPHPYPEHFLRPPKVLFSSHEL